MAGVSCLRCGTVCPTDTTVCPRCGAALIGAKAGSEAPAASPRKAPVRRPRPEDSSSDETVAEGRAASRPAPPKATAGAKRSTGAPRVGDGSLSGRDPLIGQKLQEYVIESRLGVGGMGVVYRAVQPMIGKHVAVKVLRADVAPDPRDLDRLLDEARVVSAIKHRGIINIFGAGTLDDGRQYLIMELLEGESLEQLMAKEGRVPPGDAVVILEQTLSALAAAHAAGVVHRDLKPANIFLVREGQQVYVKLLDFGLARRLSQNVTRIAGTPDYISPEHARGRPAGPPADLYSFGVLCFHVLTGQLPFIGHTPMEVMEKHVHQAPAVPRTLNPNIPKALSELILKLLSKDPGERPDAAQVRADLRASTKQLRTAATMMSMDAIEPVGPATPAEVRRAQVLEREAKVADLKRQVGRRWPLVVGALVTLWLSGVGVYVWWPTPAPPASLVVKRPPRESKLAELHGLEGRPKLGRSPEPTVEAPAPLVVPEEGEGKVEPNREAATTPVAEDEAPDAGVELQRADYTRKLDDFAIGAFKREHQVNDKLDELRATFRSAATPDHVKRALDGPLRHAEAVCAKAETLVALNDCHDAVFEADRALGKAFEP